MLGQLADQASQGEGLPTAPLEQPVSVLTNSLPRPVARLLWRRGATCEHRRAQRLKSIGTHLSAPVKRRDGVRMAFGPARRRLI